MNAKEFLFHHFGVLAEDETIELRAFKSGARPGHRDDMTRTFTRDYNYAERWVHWADQELGWNVYYGIVPRRTNARSGRKEDLVRSSYVWADLDAKDYADGKREAQERLATFALPPHTIVDSGGGYQALWKLTDTVEGTRLETLEAVCAGLAKFLESDGSVKDASRIFRVPGSHNHKPHFTAPPLVTVTTHDVPFYTLENFLDLFPVEPSPPARVVPPLLANDVDQAAFLSALTAIDPWSMSYADWVRVLMAIHSEYPGSDGLQIAIEWGQGEKGEVEAKWRGFHETGRTNAGTVFWFAKEAGWVPPAPSYGEFIWEEDDARPKVNAEEVMEPTVAPSALHFLPLADFLGANYPKPVWLVDELLMTGSTSLLVAKPKVGKSTLAANLAFAIATGKPILGRATKQGAVYVLSLDQEPSPMQEQYAALLEELVTPAEAEKAKALPPIQIHAQYALGHALFPQLREILRREAPALLIVDTLTKLVPIKDGNSYSEVPAALAPYSQLATETGTHICFLHHAHKGIAEGADVTMGSTGFTGAVGTIMVLKKHQETKSITFEATQRWAAEVEPVAIEFHPFSRAVSILGSPEKVALEDASRRIKALLSIDQDLTEPEIKQALPSIDSFAIHRALRDLVDTAQVRKDDSKRPARYKVYTYKERELVPLPTQEAFDDLE